MLPEFSMAANHDVLHGSHAQFVVLQQTFSPLPPTQGKPSSVAWEWSGVLITMLDGSFFYCNGCCKFTDVWWCFFRSLQSMLPGSTLLRITSKGAELKREQRATRVLHGSQSRCFAYIYIHILTNSATFWPWNC